MNNPSRTTQSDVHGAAELKRGTRLGKYRLEKPVGEGGSSEVWKARDVIEGIWVALKIPQMVNGRRDNEALLREIRIVSQLRHPHIMPVKNAEMINGHAVLATELSVKTLEDCSRPMSPRRIISITGQVLDGLAYAHRHRLVHCDVSPSNIFLFPNGRAALGDFGIGQRIKGRMKTIDEFGTPGYVAPEQAYGKPTFRSDCFTVGLVLYEFLTGVLPRWPFRWPPPGYKRLGQRTSLAIVRFLKQALAVDPAKRFGGAEQMLAALRQATPKRHRSSALLKSTEKKKTGWKEVRRREFIKRYNKVFPHLFKCTQCGELVAESMLICPWCGTDRNRFDSATALPLVCGDCHRGILAEWRFCPWCYGPGFKAPAEKRTPNVRYNASCRHCGGRITRFMRYCPWCHRKVRRPWRVRPLPEICGRCGWSVDSDYWNYCPWCKQTLR